MAVEFQERPSDCRLVEAVTRMVYDDVRTELNIPDGRWDIVIFSNERRATALVTGATTRPVASSNSPGDEVLCISFKPGVYMPAFSPATMRDRAVPLLSKGWHAVDVAVEAGFFDQSHMINSLKSILGRTPSQLTSAPET